MASAFCLSQSASLLGYILLVAGCYVLEVPIYASDMNVYLILSNILRAFENGYIDKNWYSNIFSIFGCIYNHKACSSLKNRKRKGFSRRVLTSVKWLLCSKRLFDECGKKQHEVWLLNLMVVQISWIVKFFMRLKTFIMLWYPENP